MYRSKAIANKCLECAGNFKEVTICHLFDCPLWEHRFGKGPHTTKAQERMTGGIKRFRKDLQELINMGIDISFFEKGHRLRGVLCANGLTVTQRIAKKKS